VALACALASVRRLWFVTHATALHPDEVVTSMKKGGKDAFRAAAADEPAADWERDLLEAVANPNEKARAALVNEQLTELDFRMQQWVKVPRVCASISTSFGFLLATLVLRRGLVDYGPEVSADVAELFVRGLVGDAMSVAAFGLVGTTFCIAAQNAAKKLVAARLEAVDKLVELLEGGT
jgi:hypothetical protein